jgi:hypothetical protein
MSYGIGCEILNCVQVVENVVKWQAFGETEMVFLVVWVQQMCRPAE